MIRDAFLDSAGRPDPSQPGHDSAQTWPAHRASSQPGRTIRQAAGPGLPRELGLGFLYWLAFLLLLEPGNLVAVVRGGIPLTWTQEVLRIGGASLLGAAVTPLLLRLTRRLPIEGPAWRKHALVHAAGVVSLSVLLIVVAQVLAAVLLAGRDPRLQGSLGEEIARNGALLILCMAAFTGIAHAVRFLRRAELERERSAAATERMAVGPITRVSVKTRGGVLLLPLDEVDWIETQGNYLALHAGPKVHLIRGTLARFEGGLDPQEFVRIHRRTIVRADRVRELTHLSNGDASLRLADGTELRLSRSYSSRAQSVLATRPALGQPASG